MKALVDKIIITNNRYVYEKYKDSTDIVFHEKYKYMEVLELTRDRIHKGHKLLTHPLSGSVKPNETPFKSIMISGDEEDLDMDSLRIIEDSILTTRKFLSNAKPVEWTDKVVEDFKTIDLALIDNVINNLK